ncbi:FAD-dependent oxidoreductase [Desertibacillus haloalkaliphilus]|uniref:FAD-dependent oxidoreductase n=1 Tax=Desertibacillus haloalkaliphilus TaxID=1328930 RepID=UPI001C25242E|nr:FAD-dependent oxidoreductase [Desertibacillus haloalkaliphilus]MBU8905866.1 FAD-dependent oxidoreductase [Desertibacillus haloalkaliphilus]
MKYVIIGGDAAGMSAAMQIVRNDPDAEVTTLEMGEYYSYAQCGLPYVISGQVESTDDLIARELSTFRDKYGINALTLHEVTNMNPDEKTVSGINHETGETFSYNYDRLLIASGAQPLLPNWDGNELEGIHTVKTIPDIKQISNDLHKEVKTVTIVGGGYIGLEMAENFVEIGKHVRIIEQASQLATIFDNDMASHIHEQAEKHNIELVFNESVQSFSGKTRVKEVKTDKQTYNTDLVIVAIGVRPSTSFASDSLFHKHDNGALLVNRYMETNVSDVYAAGDCATQYHRLKEKDDYIPLGTHANKQGQIAGINMVGGTRTFKGVVGTSILKFFDLTLARTGLSEQEAEQLHVPFETTTLKSLHIAGYYPNPKPIHIKLMYHRDHRQLLGGQVIGSAGVDKRIDVLAAALFHGMTVHELEDLDLSYAPPFNGVWDPIQQAARRSR